MERRSLDTTSRRIAQCSASSDNLSRQLLMSCMLRALGKPPYFRLALRQRALNLREKVIKASGVRAPSYDSTRRAYVQLHNAVFFLGSRQSECQANSAQYSCSRACACEMKPSGASNVCVCVLTVKFNSDCHHTHICIHICALSSVLGNKGTYNT